MAAIGPGGERSTRATRLILLERSAQARVGTFAHPLEFSQARQRGRAYSIHLCPIEVKAAARVARLRTQFLYSL
jgi:hypothetical protein